MAGTGGGKEFLGFPIPSAAGLVASLTLLMIWIYEKDFADRLLEIFAARADAVSFVDDGERGEISDVQGT